MQYSIDIVDDFRERLQKSVVRQLISWGTAFAVFYALLYFKNTLSIEWITLIGTFTIVSAYSTYLYSSFRDLSLSRQGILSVVALYFLIALIVILFFALYFDEFNLLRSSSTADWEANFHDAIYFSGVTFSTLGYGDFLPRGKEGQYFVIAEVLLGITHSVSFISIFLNKLKS
jgi:hypothetical protein